MDYLAAPLEALRARAMEWLIREEVRLLRVPVDPELHEGARTILASLEWAPDNRRALFELTRGEWGECRHELRELYDGQVVAFECASVQLPPLPESIPTTDPVVAFAADASRISEVFSEPDLGTVGIIVVLVGDRTPDPGILVGAPGLDRVRWIWLGAPEDGADSPLAWTVRCRIDPAAQKRETDSLLTGVIAAVAAGAPGSPAGARPKMPPPPHPADPAGAGAVMPAPYLHPMLLGIEALRASELERAQRCFRDARDAALSAGSAADAAEMEILAGAAGAQLALAKGAPIAPAASMLDAAAKRAEGAGLLALAAKAKLVEGTLAQAAGQIEAAARSLLAAAELAHRGGNSVLRFHALRLAGDLAAGAALNTRAADLWTEALNIVKELDPIEAQSSGLAAAAAEIERARAALRAPAPGTGSPRAAVEARPRS
jgi:hypothetical protein